MHELDGEAAGGQFLRTALALAAIEGQPVRIENVRGDRPTPGLAHQHLAVVETMSELCDADVSGASLGAETVVFEPGTDGRVPGGEYVVEIPTAGSVTLLFDALLALAGSIESTLSVTATGGTDVAWSPPLDYLRRVKLPLLERFGIEAAVDCERRGFYPEGGGTATLRLSPSTIEPIHLTDRGSLSTLRLHSIESASLADRDVARRQLGGARERLDPSGDVAVESNASTVESPSPGSAIVIELGFERSLAGTDALGERGKPAERVGEEAADEALALLASSAAIDPHLADQLLVFLALSGGRLRIPSVTAHVAAAVDLLASFDRGLAIERPEATTGSPASEERVITATER